jgi:hypothetical protein
MADEEEDIDCDELVRQADELLRRADELEASSPPAQSDNITFGPLVCNELFPKLKSITGRQKFYDKDKKKSDTSQHVVVEVCAEHVLSTMKEKSRYSKHMRLANQAFGISLSDKLSGALSGVICSTANATGTVLKSLYCNTYVEGLAANTNRVVAVDSSVTTLTTLNPNVTVSVAGNTMTFSFHDVDECDEDDNVTFRLNETDSDAEWPRKQLVGCCSLDRSGWPIKMEGPKFFCNLAMHNQAHGSKVFSLSLWRDLSGNAFLKLTTSIGEVETRTFSMQGVSAADHITFGVQESGQAEDTYAELIAAQDEDAVSLSRKRGGAQGVGKASSKKGRFESRSHKEWGATLDLSELVRAIEPIKDTIAALWLHPFTSCLVFHALLVDGDVLVLSIANAVEDD